MHFNLCTCFFVLVLNIDCYNFDNVTKSQIDVVFCLLSLVHDGLMLTTHDKITMDLDSNSLPLVSHA
jgi:hypothetical protein